MKILTFAQTLIVLAVCSVCILIQQICYYNNNSYKGNVTPTVISLQTGSDKNNSRNYYLNFDYGQGKHGYTSQEYIKLAFAQGKLPWLYCDVSSSGKADCYLPGMVKFERIATIKGK